MLGFSTVTLSFLVLTHLPFSLTGRVRMQGAQMLSTKPDWDSGCGTQWGRASAGHLSRSPITHLYSCSKVYYVLTNTRSPWHWKEGTDSAPRKLRSARWGRHKAGCKHFHACLSSYSNGFGSMCSSAGQSPIMTHTTGWILVQEKLGFCCVIWFCFALF